MTSPDAKKRATEEALKAPPQNAEPREKIDIPLFDDESSQYSMSGLVRADGDAILSTAKRRNFHFAPLNARKGADGKKMPIGLFVEDGNVVDGSVGKYMTEGLSANNYIFIIRDKHDSSKAIGAFEFCNIKPKGNAYEAEFGIWLNPDYQAKKLKEGIEPVPLRTLAKQAIHWMNEAVDVNSLYATVSPNNKTVKTFLENLNIGEKRFSDSEPTGFGAVHVGKISPDDSPYLDRQGKKEGRDIYAITPTKIKKRIGERPGEPRRGRSAFGCLKCYLE